MLWYSVKDGDDRARGLFNRHYSRRFYRDGRRPRMFVGPGEKMVLLTQDCKALFVWRKFIENGKSKPIGVICRTSLLEYVRPSYKGRLLINADYAYTFGELPLRSGSHGVIPGKCTFCKKEPENIHPMPRKLFHVEHLVSWFSSPGEIIIDMFSGSGTTGIACKNLNRKAILIEINKQYCDYTIERLKQHVLPLMV